MKLKLLKRFWPGLLCLLATFLILNSLLEPRPLSIKSLPIDAPNHGLDHVLSPDGRYLATNATNMVAGHGAALSPITVYDLATEQKIFNDVNDIRDFRFDADGNLIYLVTQHRTHQGQDNEKQLLRYHPGDEKSQLVWSHQDIGSKAGNRIIAYLGNLVRTYFHLSPDARTLVFTTFDKTMARGELIDVATAKVRAAFTINTQAAEATMLHEIETVFACDSKTVILQTSEIDHDKQGLQRYWHWIDVQTGKKLKSVPLPAELVFEEYLFATATTPVAKAYHNLDPPLLLFAINDQIRSVKIDETRDTRSVPPRRTKFKTNTQHVGLPQQQMVVYGWTDYAATLPRSEVLLSYRNYRGFDWAILDLATGKPFSTGFLPFSQSSPDQEADEAYHLLAAFPGPYLLIQHIHDGKEGWIHEGLSKVLTWLGVKQDKSHALHLIDGKTVRTVNSIHVPQSQTTALLTDSGKKLMIITGGFSKHLEVRLYDFPLHQPWLLIWTWALGVGIGVTLLAEARRALLKRKSRL